MQAAKWRLGGPAAWGTRGGGVCLRTAGGTWAGSGESSSVAAVHCCPTVQKKYFYICNVCCKMRKRRKAMSTKKTLHRKKPKYLFVLGFYCGI